MAAVETLAGPGAGRDVARVERVPEPQPLAREDLKPVVYVMSDLAGEKESPVYAILALDEKLDVLTLPGGEKLERYSIEAPETADRAAMK